MGMEMASMSRGHMMCFMNRLTAVMVATYLRRPQLMRWKPMVLLAFHMRVASRRRPAAKSRSDRLQSASTVCQSSAMTTRRLPAARAGRAMESVTYAGTLPA